MSLELAVLALIALGIVGLIRGASGPDADQAMAASPVVTVELSTVTPAIAADYQYAADHLAEFAQIPCYCGCDSSKFDPATNSTGHRKRHARSIWRSCGGRMESICRMAQR